jgi:hypothetical protein
MWHAKSPPDCVLTDYQIVSLEIVYWNIFVTGNILSSIVIAKMFYIIITLALFQL